MDQAVKISTKSGTLRLIPATSAVIGAIASDWPLGMDSLEAEQANTDGLQPRARLVFERESKQVLGLKLQPMETDLESALVRAQRNDLLIAAALGEYLSYGHEGVLLPSSYVREKEKGYESGLAFFFAPRSVAQVDGGEGVDQEPAMSEEKSTLVQRIIGWFRPPPLDGRTLFDEELGDGATSMLLDMASAIAAASKRLSIPMATIIGTDVRSRNELGTLTPYVLIRDSTVVIISAALSTNSGVWDELVDGGFEELPYIPGIAGADASPGLHT